MLVSLFIRLAGLHCGFGILLRPLMPVRYNKFRGLGFEVAQRRRSAGEVIFL
jgi:hypothetical protein